MKNRKPVNIASVMEGLKSFNLSLVFFIFNIAYKTKEKYNIKGILLYLIRFNLEIIKPKIGVLNALSISVSIDPKSNDKICLINCNP